MVDGIIFLSKGKMYVIGMDSEKPVYYPLTMHELKQMLKETEDSSWPNVSHPSSTEILDTHSHVASVMSAEEDA